MIRECLTNNHTLHATNRISPVIRCIIIAAFCFAADSLAQAAEKNLPIKGEVFTIKDRTAFLILPEKTNSGNLIPWVWYAPTLSGLCLAGIYPVCNLSSYPGLDRACGAYGMTEEQLAANLTKHNPIDRLAPLAKVKVPIFHIHGDSDRLVPLDKNSSELKKRYVQLGGKMTLEIVEGQGHNMWPGWFHSQELVDFVIAHAREDKANKAIGSDKK